MDQDLTKRRILLLHGLTRSPKVFDKLINQLENRGCYCFAPTLLGHRDNHPYSQEVCYQNFISELDEYVNYLTEAGKFEIQIVGVSFGALLALMALKESGNLISKMVLISPPVEFRNFGTRVMLPLLGYIPESIARHLGSIAKTRVSDGGYDASSVYSINLLTIMSKIRREVLNQEIDFNGPSLLIQSTFDHHINPYSLYYLRNNLLGDQAKIVLRDWGKSHNILDLEDAVSIISNFILG